MADIRVKPRAGTPWWFWVILALALAALVFFALDLFGGAAGAAGGVGDAGAGGVGTPGVEAGVLGPILLTR